MTRRGALLLCAVAFSAGFTHAALTIPDAVPPADVQCFEDGSCSNGWCDPLQQCNEARFTD